MQVQSVWPHNFTIEKQIIDKLINHLALDVQHIGSTSVPGLSAKPIIDILVGVKDGTLDQLIKPMITTYT